MNEITTEAILSQLSGGKISSSSASSGTAGLFQALLSQSMGASQTDESQQAGSASSANALASNLLSLTSGDAQGVRDAFLLLCFLMSSQGMGSAASAMLTSLSGAMGGLTSDALDGVRQDVLSSDYGENTLDKVNNMFFSGSASEQAIPYAASKAVNPPFVNGPDDRGAAQYRQVIDQFSVESNPRYKVNKKGQGDTYCNIFLWDVTRAMGAEIPHYVDAKTSEARYYPDTKGARELNANGVADWLGKKGADYGWVPVTARQAQELANQGRPVVTAFRNPGGSGHVQVVCPSADGQYDEKRGVTVAQAGSRLSNYVPITDIFSARSLDRVVYYAHA